MNDKYYIPTIEEFHVGFEYEEKSSGIWTKRIYDGINPILKTSSDNSSIQDYINCEICRVKYLDSEDIKILGFYPVIPVNVDVKSDYNVTHWATNLYADSMQILKDYPYTNNMYSISFGNPGRNKILFDGVIKNKSELKQILKMIGVVK